MALVGGTGSGKSSLLNALAGTELVPTGVLRPTTQRPAAWVAETADDGLLRLLEDTGVEERHGYGFSEHLAVIDLPDLDSVELAHRATVDALLPRADLIVWVLDPQKYNDRLAHDRIAARAAYARESLFVLNQADRLTPSERDALRRDLESTLRADGLQVPTVLVTAAAPARGERIGIETLRRELDRRARAKDAVLAKLARDLAQVVDQLGRVTGVDEGAGADAIAGRWEASRDAAAEEVATAVVDEDAVDRGARAGVHTAVATGSGPAGRAWHTLRRSPVGRALGLPADAPADTRRLLLADESSRTRAGAATTLTRGLVDLSADLGGEPGRRLRRVAEPSAVADEVAGAREGALAEAPPPDAVPRRGTWVAAGVVQTLLTLAVVWGAAWWWVSPTAVRPGSVPWPLVLIVGGLALGWLVVRSLRRSGERAGRATVLGYREALAAAVGDRLEERLGTRVRGILEGRRRLRDALASARSALR